MPPSYYEGKKMTVLEIIMLVIGLVCFVASFILTNDDDKPAAKEKGDFQPELSDEQKEMIANQVEKVVTDRMIMLEESTEAALDKISNTKVMEMGEYAESVLAQINKNHNETVFMYDMLNEKSKEIKNVVKEINEVKNRVDESKNTMGEDTARLEELIKDAETAVKEMDIAIKAVYKTKAVLTLQQEEEKQPVPDNVITPQFFEKKEEAEEESDVNEQYAYMAKAEPETMMASNCNEQILALYAQGKSNLEIAKALNLGMGEVKLVIDLFNKNR